MLFKKVEDKTELENFLKAENSEKLKDILRSCGEYGSYSAIYKITKQEPPSPTVLETFIKNFDLK